MSMFLAMGAAGAVAAFALVGCGDDGASEQKSEDVAVSTTAKTESSSSPESSRSTTKYSSQAPESDVITPVNVADYTPADSANTRLFQLADGKTKCFLNNLNGDVYLACQTEIVNPPRVDDGSGNMVPANAVSWNPSGVNYDSLMFPAVADIKTLPARSSLSSFGYTCTAYGPATVECAGPAGDATIDAGKVTGARVPEPSSPAPAGQTEGQGGQGAQGGQGGQGGQRDQGTTSEETPQDPAAGLPNLGDLLHHPN